MVQVDEADKLQGPAVPFSPVQSVNVLPLLGVAVSVTLVPAGKTKPQTSVPEKVKSVLQLMPLGLLVMVPPALLTATDKFAGSPHPPLREYGPGGGT